MSTDVAANFENLFSWEYYFDTIGNGLETISLTHSDNSSVWQNLVSFHSQANTLIFVFVCGIFFALSIWILSLLTGLCTWVDKLWSIFPIIYALHFAVHDHLYWSSDTPLQCSVRLWIVAVLISIWGARTTHMFYRKGGYSNNFIDHRWIFIRKLLSTREFFIFNLLFICLYENLLLVLLTVPLYVVQKASHIEKTPLNWIDGLASIGLIASLILEHLADNQQWEFYERKRIAIEGKEDLSGDVKRGFLSHGLFRYSRHPNYFAEMSIWWCVYIYSVAATYPIHVKWVNPSIVGTILLTVLFQGSTPLVEYLSSLKYSSYQQYKKTTSRIIPLFPGRPLDDFDIKSK